MNKQEFQEKLKIYNRNTFLLFLLQRRDDERIRKEICSICTDELKRKRGCINHYGKTFCELLVKKRKKNKKLNYAWQFNLLTYSPYLKQSKLLSKVANSLNTIT